MSFTGKKYDIIYADPPWKYDNAHTGGSLKSGSASKYPVSSLDDICRLPVANIAKPESLLFLWCTVPLIYEGFITMRSWGFTYKTAFFWEKTGRLGMGFWFRGQVEMLLLGVKGKVAPFRSSVRNIIHAPAGVHSEKPDAVRKIIETVTAKSFLNPDKIELFARKQVEGWDAWGDEIKK